ncbi:MAG: response regulator [Ramlibacter sp.]
MALVLVVDDDRMMRTVAAHALSMGGHQVIEAADGTEGLELARTRQPQLILCDVVMPGISGFEFVSALRQEAGISDLPVIMLTAMGDRANMRTGMNSGADDYIAKPFSVTELNEAVKALLAKRMVLHEGVMASMSTTFIAAMDEQREVLASQYEKRFISELSSRWDKVDDHNTELNHPDAVVMQVDILGTMLERIAAAPDSSNLVRKVYQGARDALHLFSAQHLLASGNDLIAVFVDEDDSVRVSASLRAVKAAFTLSRAVQSALRPAFAGAAADPVPRATICIHRGAVKLLHVSDPLHGDPDSVLATGSVMSELAALRDFAREAAWGVASSAFAARDVLDKIVVGRSAQVAAAAGTRAAVDAVEVTALA